MKKVILIVLMLMLVGCCGSGHDFDFNTLLYLQFEEGFKDSSDYDHPVTPVGDVYIEDGAATFNGGYLEIPDHPVWAFDDFKISYSYKSDDSNTYVSCGQYADADNYWYLRVLTNIATGLDYIGQIKFEAVSGGVTVASYQTGSFSIGYTGIFHHIEIVREGENVYAFVDGSQRGFSLILTPIPTNTLPDFAAPLLIGQNYIGQMDGFRITTP